MSAVSLAEGRLFPTQDRGFSAAFLPPPCTAEIKLNCHHLRVPRDAAVAPGSAAGAALVASSVCSCCSQPPASSRCHPTGDGDLGAGTCGAACCFPPCSPWGPGAQGFGSGDVGLGTRGLVGLGTHWGWSSPLLEALGARAAPSLLQKHESLPRVEVKNLNA